MILILRGPRLIGKTFLLNLMEEIIGDIFTVDDADGPSLRASESIIFKHAASHDLVVIALAADVYPGSAKDNDVEKLLADWGQRFRLSVVTCTDWRPTK